MTTNISEVQTNSQASALTLLYGQRLLRYAHSKGFEDILDGYDGLAIPFQKLFWIQNMMPCHTDSKD
jgi:hypothetical protein